MALCIVRVHANGDQGNPFFGIRAWRMDGGVKKAVHQIWGICRSRTPTGTLRTFLRRTRGTTTRMKDKDGGREALVRLRRTSKK